MRKTMAEVLVLFREVDIEGAVLPEKVEDSNIREPLTRWISCQCLTTAVAESLSILVRRLIKYDKHWYRTTLWFSAGDGACCTA